MNIEDLDAFSAMLGEMFDVLAPDRDRPDPQRTATWFSILVPYPLQAVCAGMEGHMRKPMTGRTLPVPSDIVAQIEALVADDGRPGPEEAWSIALTSRDEADTVVWTPEIAHAWGVARHVIGGGDEVGARMAFKEAYMASVEESRRSGRPHQWSVAEGHDPTRRGEALRVAAMQGRIAIGYAADVLALPAPREPVALLALARDTSRPSPAAQRAIAALQGLRERLANPDDTEPSRDRAAKERTADLRREAASAVASYQQQQGATT